MGKWGIRYVMAELRVGVRHQVHDAMGYANGFREETKTSHPSKFDRTDVLIQQ